MNRMLPDDIRIYNLTLAPNGNAEQILSNDPFHATKSACGKLYIYKFCTNPIVEPTLRKYCAHAYLKIDLILLEECLSYFVGTHNFRAYGNKIENSIKDFEKKLYINFTSIRTVNSIRLIKEDKDGYYRIEFNIKSALYRMIRNIVGTSLEVAAGRMSLQELKTLLDDAPDRTKNKAKSAPPEGLSLDHVFYDNY
jgi:tRNA pseudouridine38-40 synthase